MDARAPARRRRQRPALLPLALVSWCGLTTTWAAPPDLAAVTRTQTRSPGIAADRTLRIWMFNIGQGDSILIELPPVMSTKLGNPAGDPVNILVDGGSTPVSLATRAPQFLHHRYGSQVTIEHMVLTHHDRDHVVGLTAVLDDDTIEVDRVYANGLGSFKRGVLSIPTSGSGGGFVYSNDPQKKRSLGRFLSSGRLEAKYRIANMDVLKRRVNNDELNSDYGAFAKAVVQKTLPKPVTDFAQACFDCGTLAINVAKTATNEKLEIRTVWPRKELRFYSDWGKTTNGNSVAFNLTYGEFSMLFTGDLNEQSEPDLLALLEDQNLLGLINVDILKAAHHGSRHNAEAFIQHPTLKPVITIASMGGSGFMSTYKHPDEGIITTLGGALRFYSTYIREVPFKRTDLTTQQLIDGMIEDTHVLIETDGAKFRIVEVSMLHDAPILEMDDVLEGNGTPWISTN
jgi:beta-lactamase superfamily II metal-dependent hydrolase